MNLKSVKSAADLKLDGVAFDCEFRDGSLAAVTMTDKSGNFVRVAMDSYVMRALVPAPPQKKTIHVVSGRVRVLGTEIREQFDELFDANSRRSELEQSDVCEQIEVKAEEVEIPF